MEGMQEIDMEGIFPSLEDTEDIGPGLLVVHRMHPHLGLAKVIEMEDGKAWIAWIHSWPMVLVSQQYLQVIPGDRVKISYIPEG